MSNEECRSNSFVVRIWQEQADGKQSPFLWRGWIQHAFTGQVFYFHSINDMLTFIEDYTGPLHKEASGEEKEGV